MTNPGAVTRFIRRIFGLDYPDPVLGQRWLSAHSCKVFEVVGVDVTDGGCVWVTVVAVQHGRPAMPSTYAYSLAEWRFRLRAEKRVLFLDPNA